MKYLPLCLLLVACSSGPQIPIQGTTTTIQLEVTACEHRETVPEVSHGEEFIVPDGPAVGGACNVAIWLDTNPGADQTTRGVETGPVDVDADIDVPIGG